MRAALSLAQRGLGLTAPNPTVGCVIAKDGRVMGRGVTQPGGRPHAEQVALAQARAAWGAEALRGATAWVTLEPCAHHGRTPPCADALAAAGVSRVVSTVEDPDPRVRGRGFAALRAAGLEVTTGVLADEALALNVGFFTRLALGRPHVTLKLAAALDGRIATASGESRWITGPAARARTHLMRARSDAVLVGAGTARTDDPMLDVRLPGLEGRRPLRIVADGGLSLSLMSRLVRSAGERPLLLMHREGAARERRDALRALGVEMLPTGDRNGELLLSDALARLGARGVTRVLCEGGGRIAAALLRDDLVDEIAWFAAGAVLGADAAPAVGRLCVERLANAPTFTLSSHERLGGDTLSVWTRPLPGLRWSPA
ncbi:diaminohydroxyphosphoribosylaminopyrimidine deaminase / 5-amino-6-(5-phosphoribosylamino)uracil reductase [Rubrimonas cliftonensis]|uniref:Riboflavin biosynthesis protein RibD n=2 Tax=Rubrimonas cliftonensis TaxID=89524 RepID=A0A1H3WM58_9RHOB|nr:bifunctional diaminohydroxyphosphoribosylaminopyrimidine deaminase/5-amino-6-(5-phosphoribosylamino)uracil reductase RibD [Rubrimonas cliftonensis]SDZ88247.1 diaminohydroxyphosphoribosylaminopyrimidine deaminase / 5-amino-6-(5-phosphoribosylamino)uracil reductase [Rubrimonas cliftonensis]